MLGFDKTSMDTARRELEEETGAKILFSNNREELFHLKDLYTDTGKLSEMPGYFLAFVDRELQMERLRINPPSMEDPVWISLRKFYEAIFSNEPIQLEHDEHELVFLQHEREEFFGTSLMIDEAKLEIVDAFTSQIGLLTMPHLKNRFENDPTKTGRIADCFDLDRFVSFI